jgi:restriction endonuclease Mrr
MYLTTAEIAEILENVEDLSPKRLGNVIIDMAERINYLERCYMDIAAKQNQLVEKHKGEHNQ